MGIPDHLTCLLRNLYAGQEATVRTEHGKLDWFKIGKKAHQGCILSPCLFNLCRVHHEKCQAGWIIGWTQDCWEKYQMCRWYHFSGKNEEELKRLLMKVKEESEKPDLKLNIQKTHIMASGPITSWWIDGEKVETVSDFIFLFSKINSDSNCSHKIKRCLFLGRKVVTNLDSILKSRDITLPTKVHIVKAMVLPVIMYGCESWTTKKAKCQRIDGFTLWCWRRLFKSPLDIKEIKPVNPKWNQSWIFIGRTDAEVPILWLPEAKSWLTGKDPDLGKDWGQ